MPITDAFLSDVANELGPVYFRLGLILNVQRADILRLEANHSDVWRRNYEMLVKWREVSKNRAKGVLMIEDLVKALTQLQLTDVAEKVTEGKCWIKSSLHCNMISQKYKCKCRGRYFNIVTKTINTKKSLKKYVRRNNQ